MARRSTTKRRSKKQEEQEDDTYRSFYAKGGEVVDIPEDEEPEDNVIIHVDPETGLASIDNEDGSITVGAPSWQKPDIGDETHNENLALKIDPIELGRISNELLDAIASDKQDRSQWEQMRAKCLELLGMKLEDPKGDVSRSALGISTSVVRDPTLAQAVDFFRANAYAEMCPPSGPVKVEVVGNDQTEEMTVLAQELEDDLNYYFTTTASEYYPDMYFMLWWTGLASGTFKKIYMCPLKQRPVSEFVDGTDLIVSSTATDLKNAPRVTHEVTMAKDVMRVMQLEGVYRDILLGEPLAPMLSPVDAKKANITGNNPQPQRVEDQEYTLYECYCKLDIKGYEHTKNGKPTGLPLPYRVTVDETSREVLEVRRNWAEEDNEETYRPPQIPFVLFPYSTGMSRIYGVGLGQMMGNMASALTALMRLSIDNGVMSNYPGLLKAKGSGRQLTNEIMVPPGGCAEIDTAGLPIQQVVMGMPFKDISAAVMQFIEQTRNVAKSIGGTGEMPLGEGRQDAPVGTTLALLEQATKPLSATHKMLHAAQSEEFRLIVDLLRTDPESLWRGNRRPAMGTDKQIRVERLMRALDACEIQPRSDPNVPSETHRKLLALGLKQLTQPAPGMPSPYNQVEIDRYIAHAVYKMSDNQFNKFIAAPQAAQPPPINPLAAAKLQIDDKNAETKRMQVMLTHQTNQEKLKSSQEIEATKMAMQHSANNAEQPDQAPDPLQHRALDLKEQQIQDARTKMMIDAQTKHADRNSKEAIEALKFAQGALVHPEATPIANAEIGKMSEIIAPASSNNAPPMSGGGPVRGADYDDKLQHLAGLIADELERRRSVEYLRDFPTQNGYPN